MGCDHHRIGFLYDFDDTKAVTFQGLKDHIKRLKEVEVYFKETSGYERKFCAYTMQDYLDQRKSTNLIRFKFCPFCGEKIDWAMMRKEANEDG